MFSSAGARIRAGAAALGQSLGGRGGFGKRRRLEDFGLGPLRADVSAYGWAGQGGRRY